MCLDGFSPGKRRKSVLFRIPRKFETDVPDRFRGREPLDLIWMSVGERRVSLNLLSDVFPFISSLSRSGIHRFT